MAFMETDDFKIYANLSGNAGVTHYSYGETSISVIFRGGRSYTYSYPGAGAEHIEEMKRLADSGQGLSAYITRNVRTLYDR